MSINYKELILKNVEEATQTQTKVKVNEQKKKPTITYHIDGVSGPDMVITKTTPRKSEQLVMLMSQNQLYIKDLKDKTTTIATPELVARFFDNLEQPLECVDEEGNKLNWAPKIIKGMTCARVIHKVINLENIKPYMNNGFIYLDLEKLKESNIYEETDKYKFKDIQIINEFLPASLEQEFINCLTENILLKGYYIGYNFRNNTPYNNHSKIVSLLSYCQDRRFYPNDDVIEKNYGIMGFKRMLEEYFQTAISTFPNFNTLSSLFLGNRRYDYNRDKEQKFNFDLNNLLRYLFYSSVEQGYGTQINNFIETWTDTLIMGEKIFKNGIEEKYPENLATLHQIYSYKYELMKQQIDKENWENSVKYMEQFERYGEVYSIICPKEPNDMIEEARQQSNCLSSYVNHVTNGECMIFFLRKTGALNKSLVTIEITKDGKLGQVKAKYNQSPEYEEQAYVEKWYREKVVKILNKEKVEETVETEELKEAV